MPSIAIQQCLEIVEGKMVYLQLPSLINNSSNRVSYDAAFHNHFLVRDKRYISSASKATYPCDITFQDGLEQKSSEQLTHLIVRLHKTLLYVSRQYFPANLRGDETFCAAFTLRHGLHKSRP